MKRILSVGLGALLALIGAAAPVQAQQLKIGFLDAERVLAEAPAFADVRATLEREFGTERAALDSIRQAIEAEDQALQAQATTLSEAVRQQRAQALQQNFIAFQERAGRFQQAVQAREAELVQPVMTRIRGVLEEVRREGAFSFIIDPPDGLVLASDPALDVTDRVITRLGQAAR